MGKMPVLRDEARNRLIPETSIIIEYLQRFYPGRTAFIPDDAEQALHVRLRDRFFDFYVNDPMTEDRHRQPATVRTERRHGAWPRQRRNSRPPMD